MIYLLQDSLDELPTIDYERDDYTESLAYIRIYAINNSFVWYILEYNQNDQLYCLAKNENTFEFVFVSLDELETIILQFGLIVIKDNFFEPTPISKIKELYELMSEDEVKKILVEPKHKKNYITA